MASHYGLALCTSPPPLNADDDGDEDDDNDDDDNFGRLKSGINDAVVDRRFATSFTMATPGVRSRNLTRDGPNNCVPLGQSNIINHLHHEVPIVESDIFSPKISEGRCAASPHLPPRPEDDDDDDFGSFEGHVSAINGVDNDTEVVNVDHVNSTTTPECSASSSGDIPVQEIISITDAANPIDVDGGLDDHDSANPESKVENVNGNDDFSFQHPEPDKYDDDLARDNLQKEEKADNDGEEEKADNDGEEDNEYFSSFQVSNVHDNDDQHSEHTFQASTDEQLDWAAEATFIDAAGIQQSDFVCAGDQPFTSDFQKQHPEEGDEKEEKKDPQVELQKDVVDEDDDENDFGSFANFEDDPTKGTTSCCNDDDADWGDFTQDIRRPPELVSHDDDEFGDFGSAQGQSVIDGAATLSYVQEDACGDRFGELLTQAFPRPTTSPLQSPSMTVVIDSTRADFHIWKDLCDLENTNALTYHWSRSHSNRTLLDSLHVESRNLLPSCGWNSSVPAFASTLTAAPLEPTKASPNEDKPAAAVVSTRQELSVGSTTSSVPPVKFDWSGSGLVNPLDDASSPLLDLDFFVTNEVLTSDPSCTGTALNSLEEEFLRGTDKRPTDGLQQSPIIQKILRASTAVETAVKRRPACELSEEAQRVIAKMPDLSFLTAKVLMFPIRSQLP